MSFTERALFSPKLRYPESESQRSPLYLRRSPGGSGSSALTFGRVSDVLLCFSVDSCLNSGKGRRRSFVPTPKWCWWAASWTWGRMSTPWGNCPSSASSLSPTSRWDDGCLEERSGKNNERRGERQVWKQHWMQRGELESDAAIICDFSMLDQQWNCLSGEVPQEGSARGGSCNTINHHRIRAVRSPSGTCCWRFDWNFADRRCTVRLHMARAAEEAQAASGVYV